MGPARKLWDEARAEGQRLLADLTFEREAAVAELERIDRELASVKDHLRHLHKTAPLAERADAPPTPKPPEMPIP